MKKAAFILFLALIQSPAEASREDCELALQSWSELTETDRRAEISGFLSRAIENELIVFDPRSPSIVRQGIYNLLEAIGSRGALKWKRRMQREEIPAILRSRGASLVPSVEPGRRKIRFAENDPSPLARFAKVLKATTGSRLVFSPKELGRKNGGKVKGIFLPLDREVVADFRAVGMNRVTSSLIHEWVHAHFWKQKQQQVDLLTSMRSREAGTFVEELLAYGVEIQISLELLKKPLSQQDRALALRALSRSVVTFELFFRMFYRDVRVALKQLKSKRDAYRALVEEVDSGNTEGLHDLSVVGAVFPFLVVLNERASSSWWSLVLRGNEVDSGIFLDLPRLPIRGDDLSLEKEEEIILWAWFAGVLQNGAFRDYSDFVFEYAETKLSTLFGILSAINRLDSFSKYLDDMETRRPSRIDADAYDSFLTRKSQQLVKLLTRLWAENASSKWRVPFPASVQGLRTEVGWEEKLLERVE